ncbi:MAG: hypothetical protein JKY71_02585 [Alphaproteobacteria bacterium]|nr:hypothetical protein [Alphaproteobacteria bacterium]
MSTLVTTIDTSVLSNDEDGFIVSYEDEARLLGNNAENQYRTAHGRLLSDQSAQKAYGEPLAKMREFARPTVLGYTPGIGDGPEITASGIVIKNKNSLEIAVPQSFADLLPIADYTARDLLGLYGPEGFEKAAIQLVVQRTVMEPNEAHRKPFAGWHDHMSERKVAAIDLVYAFSDVLPTEFKINGQEKTTAPESLTRFGAEFLHRSPTNKGDSPLQRTWGGLIVIPHDSPNILAINQISKASEDAKTEFRARAAEGLRDFGSRVKPIAPEPLF